MKLPTEDTLRFTFVISIHSGTLVTPHRIFNKQND